MKIICITLSTLFLLSLQAWSLTGLKCITSGLPTTSFVLEEKTDSMQLRVIHHNGTKYAPVFAGIITPSDLSLIQKSSDFWTRLGDNLKIHFKKEKCRLEENKFFTCSLPGVSDLNGEKVESLYFTTSETVDRIPDFEFVRTTVKLYARQGTDEYKLEMGYYDNDCKIQLRK